MKKSILLVITTIILATLLFATPIFAATGSNDVTIDLSGNITGGHHPGEQIILGGTITVSASASDYSGFLKSTYAFGEASYTLYAPDGSIIASGYADDTDYDISFWPTNSSVVVTIPISEVVVANQLGEYLFSQSGDAVAAYLAGLGYNVKYDADTKTISWWVVKKPDMSWLGESDGWAHIATQFELLVGTNHGLFKWNDGKLPAIDIDGMSYGITNTKLRVVIPEGTTATTPKGDKLDRLSVRMTPAGLLFGVGKVNATFSNTVIVYQEVDGKWVEVVKFNLLKDGVPFLILPLL